MEMKGRNRAQCCSAVGTCEMTCVEDGSSSLRIDLRPAIGSSETSGARFPNAIPLCSICWNVFVAKIRRILLGFGTVEFTSESQSKYMWDKSSEIGLGRVKMDNSFNVYFAIAPSSRLLEFLSKGWGKKEGRTALWTLSTLIADSRPLSRSTVYMTCTPFFVMFSPSLSGTNSKRRGMRLGGLMVGWKLLLRITSS